MHGIVDEKTDVFAFGVLLLEIITGRKPVDSSRQNLVLWVCETLDNVTFPNLYTNVGSLPNILKIIYNHSDAQKSFINMQAKPLMESGNITELVDPSLKGEYDTDQMHRLVLTADYCVRQTSARRPSMSEVYKFFNQFP